MSARKQSRKRSVQKVRGPSRPIDPRYAPGAPGRRGPDSTALAVIGGVSALALVLLVWLLASRGSTSPAANVPNVPGPTGTAIAFATQTGGLPRISAADAINLQAAGSAQIIDVRVAASFDQQRIKGAVNIPQGEALNRIGEIPREGEVILYCQ